MSDIAVVSGRRRRMFAALASPALRSEKFLALIVSVVMIGAMLSAVVKNWQTQPQDSFPLSYFPMFSAVRQDLHTEDYVAGWDAQGRRYTIPYSYLAPGGSLVRIRRQTVRAMVNRGQAAALCQSVSRRIVQRNPAAFRSLVSLEVVSGTFALSKYLQGDKVPISEVVRATCPLRWQAA